jgi:ribosomal protein S15P/S13E
MKPLDVTSLADSIQPLKEHFNSNKAKLRFLALVSPT